MSCFKALYFVWLHSCDAAQGGGALAAPVHDINAPDLYLPVMSFITFVLITGLLKGTKMKCVRVVCAGCNRRAQNHSLSCKRARVARRFTPDMLNEITTSCLVTQLLEMGVIKLSMYLLNSTTVPLLDLVAFTGYKYIKYGQVVISVYSFWSHFNMCILELMLIAVVL